MMTNLMPWSPFDELWTLGDQLARGTSTVDEDRRVTDIATNLGAGLTYQLNKWVGLTADYRTFFVHRSDDTPHVNRFTTGLTLSLK
jgi:hypothetical protein